jgi:type I restriction enzyme S subunit
MSDPNVAWPMVPTRMLSVAIVGGGTPSRDVKSFWHGGIPWVTPGELTKLHGKYVRETAETISQAGLASSGANLLPAGALLSDIKSNPGASSTISWTYSY